MVLSSELEANNRGPFLVQRTQRTAPITNTMSVGDISNQEDVCVWLETRYLHEISMLKSIFPLQDHHLQCFWCSTSEWQNLKGEMKWATTTNGLFHVDQHIKMIERNLRLQSPDIDQMHQHPMKTQQEFFSFPFRGVTIEDPEPTSMLFECQALYALGVIQRNTCTQN